MRRSGIRKEDEVHDNRAAPALELAMQELEPMDAPAWRTIVTVSISGVSISVATIALT